MARRQVLAASGVAAAVSKTFVLSGAYEESTGSKISRQCFGLLEGTGSVKAARIPSVLPGLDAASPRDRMPKTKKKPAILSHPTTKEHPMPAKPTPVLKTPLHLPVPKIPVATAPTPTVGTTTATPSAPAQATPTTPPSTPAVGAPPVVTIPSPPAGFVTPAGRTYVGFLPSSRELAAAATAVTDLGSFDDYVALFGSAAPPAAAVANAIAIGLQWRAMRTPAEAWDAYVRAQYGAAWKEARTQLDELKPLFLHALAKDPSLASKYQGLTEMFDAPKVSASKAAATKKKSAQAKAAKATVATSTAAGAGSATSTATEAPADNTRPVTINA
jgi:hypothetical protein